MQFQREVAQDQPENTNTFNIQPQSNLTHSSKQQLRSSNQQMDKSPSVQISNHDTVGESQEVIAKIDKFNALSSKSQQDWEEFKILLEKHILPNIHPVAFSQAGKILLTNGKFIVAFIEVMTRNSKKDFLKKYLINYFQQETEIQKQKQTFRTFCQETESKANKSSYQTANRDKKHLGGSPSSSKNQVNWSSVAEHDENSSKKSFATSPSKEAQKLKRLRIKEESKSVQSDKSKRKASRNIKKNQNSTKPPSKQKSTKKTKIQIDNKQVLKNMKNSAKKTVPKSAMRLKTKSIEEVINENPTNANTEDETQLGSFYHYQIGVNRKSQKQLMQVRTSARFSKKNENQNRRASSRIKNSLSKSKSKEGRKSVSNQKKQKSKSKSKSKQKRQEAQQSHNENSSSASDYKLDNETNSQMEDMVEVDWVKRHLKQLKIKNVQLYADYKALTKNDNKITQFLLEMENSQEAEQLQNTSRRIKPQRLLLDIPKEESQPNINVNQQNNQNISEQKIEGDSYYLTGGQSSESRPKQFDQIKGQFQIGQLPLTIDYIVDPDLCNHGIYALLRLGRVTQLEMGTPFAVSPLTYSIKISRKNIKQSLEKAKQLAGQFAQNIGYVPTNELILNMIAQKKKQISDNR